MEIQHASWQGNSQPALGDKGYSLELPCLDNFVRKECPGLTIDIDLQ